MSDPRWKNVHKERYYTIKAGAKRRGIPFLLTFEEWWKLWQDSGHYHEIGVGKGKYCISRPGDRGPYALGNVRIVTQEENLREAALARTYSPETRAKMSVARKRVKQSAEMIRRRSQGMMGHIVTEETREKISATRIARGLSWPRRCSA